MKLKFFTCCAAAWFSVVACNSATKSTSDSGDSTATTLPKPYATQPATKFSQVIGWPEDKAPTAPVGFKVTRFAEQLENPRWIYQAPNGDIFVSEAKTKKGSSNRVLLFRDKNGDGKPEEKLVYLDELNRPFGMLVLNDYFYVANTDGLYRYAYKAGANKPEGPGTKILSLPAGGYNNHWTRNIIANANGSKIYISVGSGSNVGENGMEHEVRRANILEINPDGSGERVFAAGLRNPVGMDWAPGTNTLWTAVNERDNLGDNLVPDYVTSVKEGGFYGWPYSYFGQHPDPRMKDDPHTELVEKAIVPDVDLGSHTASLGLAFAKGDQLPEPYHNAAFIGQHGSWNRSEFSGYKVVFVPFENGKPSGKPQDFLTGFIANPEKAEVYGRPVGVTFLQNGSLLVADDAAGVIWMVTKE